MEPGPVVIGKLGKDHWKIMLVKLFSGRTPARILAICYLSCGHFISGTRRPLLRLWRKTDSFAYRFERMKEVLYLYVYSWVSLLYMHPKQITGLNTFRKWRTCDIHLLWIWTENKIALRKIKHLKYLLHKDYIA